MSENGKGASVPWSWVAGVAMSLCLLVVGQLWNGAKERAAEDHAQLKAQNAEITTVKNQVERVQIAVESLTKKNDARWDALLMALPEVEKKLRPEQRRTPIFEPEWHPTR